jgi:hypothetical protein
MVEYGTVDDMLGLRSVEIYYMETLETNLLKLTGYLGRGVTVDRLLVVVTLGQSDTLSVDDIYGRNQFYHNAKKFLMILSPTAPLFSGWN